MTSKSRKYKEFLPRLWKTCFVQERINTNTSLGKQSESDLLSGKSVTDCVYLQTNWNYITWKSQITHENLQLQNSKMKIHLPHYFR